MGRMGASLNARYMDYILTAAFPARVALSDALNS